jgi:hypothetical protein
MDLDSKLERVFADNVMEILNRHGMRPAAFSALCKQNKLDIDKSFLSRLFSYQINFTITKVDLLLKGLQLLEPVTASDLFSADQSQTRNEFTFVEAEDVIGSVFVELFDLGWIKLNSEIPPRVIKEFFLNRTLAIEPDLLRIDKTKICKDSELKSPKKGNTSSSNVGNEYSSDN